MKDITDKCKDEDALKVVQTAAAQVADVHYSGLI